MKSKKRKGKKRIKKRERRITLNSGILGQPESLCGGLDRNGGVGLGKVNQGVLPVRVYTHTYKKK